MVVLVLGALWLGGTWFTALAAFIGIGLVREWGLMILKLPDGKATKILLLIAGALYVAAGVIGLIYIERHFGFSVTLLVMALVWATDIGAYFTGRSVGGPKIAPRISPSKTWSGLIGGMASAALLVLVYRHFAGPIGLGWLTPLFGAGAAVLAQAGDFLESFIKRRAGVKDSGNLIPGHGGLFDRLDGLLPVLILVGILTGAYSGW
jgi:phosphatidate cytidylyltransferase